MPDSTAAKHAQATSASILFIDRDHSLILLVKDNGVGFDRKAHKDNYFGLLGIRERALVLNGKARISSKPGKGTQVVVSLPLTGKPPNHPPSRSAIVLVFDRKCKGVSC